ISKFLVLKEPGSPCGRRVPFYAKGRAVGKRKVLQQIEYLRAERTVSAHPAIALCRDWHTSDHP
ncbi:hypothetical protein, partial [Erythrobacter sp.]|uniref:hypothetical protein n=1 Tax=Erythrobacter sp. TaxID=1042 RepID=UPI003C782024